MTLVSIYLRTPAGSSPGVAVGAMWPASAVGPFRRYEFTLPYGAFDVPHSHGFESGNYWIQLKLDTGEILRERVVIPDQTELSIRLDASAVGVDYNRQENPKNYRFSPQLVETAGQQPPQIAVKSRGLVPRGSATRGRPSLSFGYAGTLTTARERLRGPIHRPNYFTFPEIGDLRFSLTSLRARSLHWGSTHGIGGRTRDRPLSPTDYFRRVLLSPDRAAMVPIVDGNNISTLLNSISDDNLGNYRGSSRPAVRDYALLSGTGERYRFLVGLPPLKRGHSAKLIVRADRDDARLVRLSVSVDDRSFKSMLEFMNSSDLGSAIHVAASSLPILYAKFDNPLAAVAAGYVLVQAPPQTVKVPWGQWIGNLGHYFPSLPDGKILHATLLLQRGDTCTPDDYVEDHNAYFPAEPDARNMLAASLVIDSLLHGPPVFRAGLALLATNLRILASVQLPQETTLLLEVADRLVTWLSMRVDPRESFCVFRLEKLE
jgi:hypothetical protein